MLLIVLGTPTGLPVGASGQSGDPLNLLGNLSAPPTTAINQSSDPFSNLASFTAPPTVVSSQSNNSFSNIGNVMATGGTGSNQSNDPFSYLANISTAPVKPATNNSTSLFTVTSPTPVVSANIATPTAVPSYNFNDLLVPLETITPGE